MAFCEGSATYPFLIAPKPFGHSLMSKLLPHAKILLYLPSQSSLANFQTFCQTEGIVKEALARFIKLSWNFAHSFMCSYYHTPPLFSPIQSSMWAQLQILDSVNIFRLWSNFYIASLILKNYQIMLLPKSLLSTKFGIISTNHFLTNIF